LGHSKLNVFHYVQHGSQIFYVDEEIKKINEQVVPRKKIERGYHKCTKSNTHQSKENVTTN